MQKGKVKVYDNWNGMITSNGNDYKFRRDDIILGKIKTGDEVEFVPEIYEFVDGRGQILTAKFVKKKELSI